MSALGHKRTLKGLGTQSWNVRFVPKADIALDNKLRDRTVGVIDIYPRSHAPA